MKDLAPTIHRQRLIIEGTCLSKIEEKEITFYLEQLCKVLQMKKLTSPVTHQSKKYGWAAWMHWETSGVHFYSWDKPTPFFSVDIYTCKKFSVNKAVLFTKKYFHATQLSHQSV